MKVGDAIFLPKRVSAYWWDEHGNLSKPIYQEWGVVYRRDVLRDCAVLFVKTERGGYGMIESDYESKVLQ